MTQQDDKAERTPLQDRLIELIKLNGPMSVADYMADALGHPHDGYYMTREALGAAGDFTTAPEISQVFGELIGLWLVEAWRCIGSPENFNLIELGPGRGVLMADVLRAAQVRPSFVRAAQVFLVETSGRMRVEQQKQLRANETKPLWADELSEIPPAPSLIFANEFFDCMPILQFQLTDQGWRERLVGLSEDGENLAFALSETGPPTTIELPDPDQCSNGDIFEYSPASRNVVNEISELLNEQGGYALIVDYGHMQSGLGDTLQAVRSHKYWPPLASPGRADITAHVDFEKLSATAIETGAVSYGPITQGRFLDRLGLSLRVEALCTDKSSTKANEIKAGAYRIAAPDQMGEIFKVLCIGSPHAPSPPGFEA